MKKVKRSLALFLCGLLAVGGIAWQLVPAVAESECTCKIQVHGSNCPLSRCTCDGIHNGEHTEDCALYELNGDLTVCVCQPDIHAEGCPRYKGNGKLMELSGLEDGALHETEGDNLAEQESPTDNTEPGIELSPDTEDAGEDLTERDPAQDVDSEESTDMETSEGTEPEPSQSDMGDENEGTDTEAPSDTDEEDVTKDDMTKEEPAEDTDEESADVETPEEPDVMEEDGDYPTGSGNSQTRGNAQVAAQAFELDAQLEEHVATVQGYLTNGDNARLLEDTDNFGDILAVYAVLSGQAEDYPYEISLAEEEDLELLHSVYWSMTQVTGLSNASGAAISVRRLSAAEGAELYNLTDEQKTEAMSLAAQSDLVESIVGDRAVVTVALSQVGNVGGEPYWSWYGFDSRVEWCATFVSWVAEQCGYIETGVIPKFAGCSSQGVPWFQKRGLWQAGSYTPSPGDIIFFDWDGDLSADHVGIVEKVENGRVYTIEGNYNDDVSQCSYPIGYSGVLGYGCPEY